MKGYKTDYIALQNLWFTCADTYNKTPNKSMRFSIINDFRDNLVDIEPEGKKALYSKYIEWEENIWLPLCKKKLAVYVKENSFHGRMIENQKREYRRIQEDLNSLRYHKILQLIQDSGIGLGQGGTGGGSFNVGPKDTKKFTG